MTFTARRIFAFTQVSCWKKTLFFVLAWLCLVYNYNNLLHEPHSCKKTSACYKITMLNIDGYDILPFLYFSLSAITPCHVFMSKNVAHAAESKVAHAWWGLDCDLRPNEKKTKPEFQLGRFLCSARIKRNVEAMIRFSGCGGFTSANPNSLITNIQVYFILCKALLDHWEFL